VNIEKGNCFSSVSNCIHPHCSWCSNSDYPHCIYARAVSALERRRNI